MLPDLIKRKLRELPDKPGCYLMRDRHGRIIYVGKASSLRHRVRSYFHRATLNRADPKIRGLVKSIADLDIIVLRSEADAILTEGKLIKDYRPRYNTLFKDDKRFPLLRIERNRPFPRIRLCRFQRNDGAAYFGPYTSSSAARAALEFVEKHYGLRKCATLIPDPVNHKHCINDIVRFCAAPCIGKTTPDEYRQRVEQACAFLSGERPAVLKEMQSAMEVAAQALNFEKAAALRDTLRLLRLAVKQRAHIGRSSGRDADSGREADASRATDTGQAGVQALKKTLGLNRPPRLIEAYDISNISGTLAVGSLVAAVDGIPKSARYRRFRIKTLQTADDARMLAEVIHRRFARLKQEGTLAPRTPDLVLVDGGLIQMRAAKAELADLGLPDIPVAGLAKRFEKIFFDRRILALTADSPALKVLQRLRDEAHRFALAYHRKLRERRIRESRLDDIPGIGETRKQAILRHFGSVARLARAPERAIAKLPGIGPALARLIKQALG
ncbi:MAG: excinuclease ABC subunit UvrC [Verrucomicrobia bacterium]|nr:excinuclease ABC subunit UvrC [Verrucomicrobiota bacterium]MBU4285266.1 excinuclease ABC subunit UvrC [Verrucomicrobiota bacterium]